MMVARNATSFHYTTILQSHIPTIPYSLGETAMRTDQS
jgi:hypothetical protein